jgi:NAD-dependent deacetylase
VAIDDPLVRLLRQANKILSFSGAGISTESGIPDFRGPSGIWKRQRPVLYQEFMSTEAARIRYWRYKLEGWEGFRDAKPNAAHYAVARLEKAGKLLLAVTQNVDGLHQAAGTSDALVVELHGSMRAVECQSCGKRVSPEPVFEEFKKSGKPAACTCGGFLKPATISFGQSLKADDLERALAAAKEADLVLALGSTLSVYPAASIPLTAARRGCPYVIINRGETDHDGSRELTLRIEGNVAEILPRAVERALEGP